MLTTGTMLNVLRKRIELNIFNKKSVVISEPMDFRSEDNFKRFCERTKAVLINEDRDLYRYKSSNENEPALYMKAVKINQLV